MKKITLNTLYFIFSILYLSLSSCNNDTNTNSSNGENEKQNRQISTQRNNLNISILLDLSDRIKINLHSAPGMEIYQRDLGYIHSISSAFKTHLQQSRIRQVDDEIQVFFEPTPSNSEINSLSTKLRLNYNKDNISKEAIAKIVPTYDQLTTQIYSLALQEKHFPGSDIWTFFKDKVKNYSIKPKHRNILIILTDGYMYYQNNKVAIGNQTTYVDPTLIQKKHLNTPNYQQVMETEKIGFIPATSQLQDLEVLVIGLNPDKRNPFEKDVLKKYWGDWLTNMGVTKYEILDSDLPSNLDPLITKFILNK